MIKEMNKTVYEISQFRKGLEYRPAAKGLHPIDRETFTLLLSGISTCRKMPGIPAHMGYEALYHCGEEGSEKEGREYLRAVYGIQGRKSLEKALLEKFSDGERYGYFMTFWVGAPMFHPRSLEPDDWSWFLECMDLAKPFYPLLKEKGFYAWGINEKIGLCRKAAACGVISDQDFWELADPWVRQAQAFYRSWEEYAVSCLCGSAYVMRQEGSKMADFLHLNMELVGQLLAEGGAWGDNGWYVPKEREWADLQDPRQQCLATRKVLEGGQVGYMYREEPADDFPDCGWRFFVGDEPEEYITQPDNVVICSFNEIANLDPTVLAYFYAGYGREFEKGEDGWREATQENGQQV